MKSRQRPGFKSCSRPAILAIVAVFIVLALAALIIFLIIYYARVADKVTVSIPAGEVTGRVVKLKDGTVHEFLGMPFAEPPVGSLRYKDPVIMESFPEPHYDALSYQQSCVQYLDTTFGDFSGSDMWNAKNPLSEDCLYLNVWAPLQKEETELLPVMVWIYGGGFYGGSNALWVYDGKALAAYGKVVVASMNYRVGSFGFLSTGDGRIAGNFGLKDQQVALQWIKRNIKHFGGDSNQITLFGESAGAASIGYHLMNPESADLFHRAILQSGSPDSHWSFMSSEVAKNRFETFISSVGCMNDVNVLTCLQSKPMQTLFDNEWVTGNYLEFPWLPTVDSDFITDNPNKLLKEGKFQTDKEVLLGTNKDEGTFWILYSVPGLSRNDPSPLTHAMYLEGIDIVDWDLSSDDRASIAKMYEPLDTLDGEANTAALDDVSGDRSFTCPTLDLASTLSEVTKTYVYYLTHRASNEVWPKWMGVIHGADIQWVFGMPLNYTRGYSNEEVQLSKVIMDYWVNFAKTGDPNGEGLTQWPEYLAGNGPYLEIASPSVFRLGSRFKTDMCNFWRTVHESLQ